jgi:hypothetical protein
MLHQFNQAVQRKLKCNKVFTNNKFGRMWKEAVMAHNFFHAGCRLEEVCWHLNFGRLAVVLYVLPGNYQQFKSTYCLNFVP